MQLPIARFKLGAVLPLYFSGACGVWEGVPIHSELNPWQQHCPNSPTGDKLYLGGTGWQQQQTRVCRGRRSSHGGVWPPRPFSMSQCGPQG